MRVVGAEQGGKFGAGEARKKLERSTREAREKERMKRERKREKTIERRANAERTPIELRKVPRKSLEKSGSRFCDWVHLAGGASDPGDGLGGKWFVRLLVKCGHRFCDEVYLAGGSVDPAERLGMKSIKHLLAKNHT